MIREWFDVLLVITRTDSGIQIEVHNQKRGLYCVVEAKCDEYEAETIIASMRRRHISDTSTCDARLSKDMLHRYELELSRVYQDSGTTIKLTLPCEVVVG